MAEGYEVIVKLNLPPDKQYHSGHSVIFQGHNTDEVVKNITAAVDDESESVGTTILKHIVEYALAGAAGAAITKKSAAKKPAAKKSSAGAGNPGGESVDSDAIAGSIPAESPVPVEDTASDALLKVVASKTGTPLADLQGISTTEAKARLKKGGQ